VIRKLETRLLAGLLAAAAAAWAFLAIGGELGSHGFQEAMRDVTALGGFTVLTLVTTVAAIAFLLHRKARHAAVLVAAALIAELASEQLKGIYGRPRPELAPHGAYVYSASFPSGHSMISAAIYLTLAMLIASLETRTATKTLAFATAVAIMLAVGVSRVYLAVHWPSDVMAGWCAGTALALVAWTALTRRVGVRPGSAGASMPDGGFE
jgi:undecaprenyl-diphosphatase